MNKKLLYTKNTAEIENVFNILSWVNIIASAIIAFAALIVTIVIASNYTLLWLIPFGVLVVTSISFILIHVHLNIKFGMYYDIRKIRMNSDATQSNPTNDIDDIPEI